MSINSEQLYELVRTCSNEVYNKVNDPLSVSRIQQAVIASALQGQFIVVFEYPKAVGQALQVEAQGNTPDFDVEVLTYYKTAVGPIADFFADSKFVLSGLPEAAGFKVSWSGAKAPEVEEGAEAEPVKVIEGVVDATKDNVE